ncbi:DUF2357 domain-containing protein [Arsukibacterium perlucidum]|uniref:DUF2357 domain-containing protein n=1 Tax=Arsukibacterium perlucidum TaxID=368811 RepID=UPI00036ACBB1|nr:DUF2357 domain-containing protein [Arsukibacterium perlucidum]
MRELLQIDTPDWQLAVYGPDVAGKQRVLEKTMASRGKPAPTGAVLFDRLLHVTTFTTEQGITAFNAEVGDLVSPKALLFENTDYMFELLFKHYSVSEPLPQITHKLTAIQNAFRSKKIGNQLLVSGTLNFGNNVGWFSLRFSYFSNSTQQNIVAKFNVLPTKMDLDSDLQAIYQRLDHDYPLWRFAFSNSTESTADGKRQSNNNFPLLWLARFTGLREKFEKNICILLNAPHSRLVQVDRRVKAERLKGKLSVALQEKLEQDFSNQQYYNSYATRRKILSLDTPENRFIKMVLQYAHSQLGRFIQLVTEANKKPDAQIFSGSFVSQLNGWQKTTEKYLHHPMFKEVGSFKGMSKESLVLQQKTGYSGVYQTWHELKRYLDVMGSQSSVSMKTIDQLYEVWCFLEIRRILLTKELGFKETAQKPHRLGYSGAEVKFDDVMADSYLFTREDGLTIKLAHEPTFGEKTKPVRSWLYDHKPDIVLEATFADSFKLLWLFDAKYRIDNKSEDSEQDLVPPDAIYQMHRYRDALIHIEKAGEQSNKSRSVYGAYALYPGANNQTESPTNSKYAEAIESIGIGAFPLLPSADGEQGCIWLKTFLLQQFSAVTAAPAPPAKDRYLLEDSARIPHHGMQQVHYPDLTLVITAAPEQGRDQAYIDSFKQGTATCYHTRLEATERINLEKNAIAEIRYCVIATTVTGSAERIAKYIWPVKSVKLVQRNSLNKQQTGINIDISDPRSADKYWLFEFGPAFELPQRITGFCQVHHEVKLTTRRSLVHISRFDKVEQVYSEVMAYQP